MNQQQGPNRCYSIDIDQIPIILPDLQACEGPSKRQIQVKINQRNGIWQEKPLVHCRKVYILL